MTTGACGIDCTVCRLHATGVCSTCGPGTSLAAREKLAAQRRLMGAGCPVLECAVERGIDHCLRDCDEFPCSILERGPYPFAGGFLDQQRRRRADVEGMQAAWPESTPALWKGLADKGREAVCAGSGAIAGQDATFRIVSLGETWIVDPAARTVVKDGGTFGGEWDRQIPFLVLAWLVAATPPDLTGEMVHPRDLVQGQDCFQGHNVLEIRDIEHAFGSDGRLFEEVCRRLGGQRIEGADVAMRLHPFPKLPVDYLLWLADEEFPAKVSILLDRGTPRHYPVDATATCVNLLTRRIVQDARSRR